MENKENIEKTIKLLKGDKYVEYSGITLDEVSEGRAVASVVINENHFNGVGTVQGGVYFTLADFAFAAASNSHGKIAVAVRCDISFIKAVKGGKLTAIAEEISCGNTIANYIVKVYNEKNEIVVLFSGTAFRKNE
jgi:acyl-CoA thioesterase